MENRAVFFDRDGVLSESLVINNKLIAPRHLCDFHLTKDAIEVTKKLKSAGFLLVVVTNQPDVAKGFPTQGTVEEMHTMMRSALPIDQIEVCYHLDEHNCDCRKPKAGMLLKAAQELNIDLSRSFMVGDRWRDIEAGQNAGCRTAWLRQDVEAKKPQNADFEADSLVDICNWILETNK